MDTLLDIRNLKVLYKGMDRPVINKLSLALGKGKVLGVVGESGCGKTTLANTIINMLPKAGKIEEGEIIFQGEDILKLSPKELRSLRGNDLGVIVQASLSSLNPLRRVGAQFTQILREKRGFPKEKSIELAEYYLNKMSCPQDTMRKFPFQLSGGQRQRVIIAMGFISNPKLLIADEPTTALDVTIQAQVLEQMMELKKEHNTSIVLISHNLGVVAQICDEIAVMYRGEIVEHGPADKILNNPLHPYTIGLINSIPHLDFPKSQQLYNIARCPKQSYEGCLFAGRCPRVIEKCRDKRPLLKEVGEGRSVACWRLD